MANDSPAAARNGRRTSVAPSRPPTAGPATRGLARALLNSAFAAHPGRGCTLVATEAGRPLYESLGFRAVATTTWYTSGS
ncbi:N-acetyltransferase [Actinoplanes siamensis]|uniref:N-acetyltransferase domain-containing protein n=1 Tax=Actinoplanes siamensis TaxID=1223317 RepID=A0A919NC13_9ACTN|nr:GNAT family N-acetyltransferase [Actinoplanes siamensis]GIF08336.1 hypothetical protein Asi03nite_58740 [Actinoplanes siamensis]